MNDNPRPPAWPDSTAHHFPIVGVHEGVQGVSCRCGYWQPDEPGLGQTVAYHAHVASAIITEVARWRREEISAGKLAERIGLSVGSDAMRDLQFGASPETPAGPTREELLAGLASVGIEPPEEPGTEWTIASEPMGPQPAGLTLREAMQNFVAFVERTASQPSGGAKENA